MMNSIKVKYKNGYHIYELQNSKISDPHMLLLNLTDKKHLRGKDKYIPLSNLRIYYTWRNIKKSYKNNKVSAPTWKIRLK